MPTWGLPSTILGNRFCSRMKKSKKSSNGIGKMIAWASDIKDYAPQAAISNKQWFGYKMVEDRSNRKYTDENAVIAAVTAVGYDHYEHKILGVMPRPLFSERNSSTTPLEV